MTESDHGHQTVSHTADLRVEAWAPTREQCVAEAVLGAVNSFVDVTGVHPEFTHRCRFTRVTDDELLYGVLDEMVYLIDATGMVPVDVEAELFEDAVDVRLAMADLADLPQVGAVPKAVSLHELRIGPGPRGWSCSVLLDV